MKTQTYNQDAIDLQQLKENMLVKILQMSGIGISPASWREWRPTKVTPGDIAGINKTVRCYATDGNLGIFNSSVETTNLGAWFLGHVRDFTWNDSNDKSHKGCPPSLFTKDPEGYNSPRKKKVAKSEKEKLRDRVAKLETLLGLG